jgi:MFS family permease
LLTLLIRRKVTEPAVWSANASRPGFAAIFKPPLARRTVLATALATSVLLGYWGLFSWLPGFLAGSRESGGAGMSILRSGLWVFVMQTGAYAGYLSFGLLADRYGRRPTFLFYVLGAAVLTPVYGLIPSWAGPHAEQWLLWMGPFIGFFGTGYFSLFGAMLAELFPTAVRGAGQGFTYNAGRAVSAFAPYFIGVAADRMGLGMALTANAGFFLLAAVLIHTLPETRSAELAEVV